MRRKRMTRKASKRKFRRGLSTVKKNLQSAPSRGGIRL